MPRDDRPSPKTLLLVGLWGAATATIAYLVSFGSPVRMIIAFVVIGVSHRLWAYSYWTRRGRQLPRWWWR